MNHQTMTNENVNFVFALGYAIKLRPHLLTKQPAFLEVIHKSVLYKKKSFGVLWHDQKIEI